MFKNRIILFIKIFIILLVICFLTFVIEQGDNAGEPSSKLIYVLSNFISNIFCFPILIIEKKFNLINIPYFWIIIEILIDILFYTIIIYYIYLWYKNKMMAKEEWKIGFSKLKNLTGFQNLLGLIPIFYEINYLKSSFFLFYSYNNSSYHKNKKKKIMIKKQSLIIQLYLKIKIIRMIFLLIGIIIFVLISIHHQRCLLLV